MGSGRFASFSLDSSARSLRRPALDRLPITIQDSRAASGVRWCAMGLFLAAIFVLMVIVFLWTVGHPPPGDERWQIVIPMLAFLALALVFVVGGVVRILHRTTITAEGDAVTVEDRRAWGTTGWAEPLADYDGVLLRDEVRREGESDVRIFLLELHHSDPARRVALYEAKEPGEPLRQWAAACRALGLPALELDGGTLVRRAPEDLHKSVHQLAQERGDAVAFDASYPPQGLRAEVAADALVITVLPPRRSLASSLLRFGGALLMDLLFFGARDRTERVLTGLISLILTASLLDDVLTRDRLKLREGSIELCRTTLGWEWGRNRLPASEVRSVTVHTESRRVQIRTDTDLVSVGRGLSDEALGWLRDCVKAVVAA
ncbi:MAG: hypothetical protein ACLF0G_06495 [Candidatus Brocadiia bacterium]